MGKSVDRKQVDEIKNDTISKDFWRNNEHFADLFNAVLLEGNRLLSRIILRRWILMCLVLCNNRRYNIYDKIWNIKEGFIKEVFRKRLQRSTF